MIKNLIVLILTTLYPSAVQDCTPSTSNICDATTPEAPDWGNYECWMYKDPLFFPCVWVLDEVCIAQCKYNYYHKLHVLKDQLCSMYNALVERRHSKEDAALEDCLDCLEDGGTVAECRAVYDAKIEAICNTFNSSVSAIEQAWTDGKTQASTELFYCLLECCIADCPWD